MLDDMLLVGGHGPTASQARNEEDAWRESKKLGFGTSGPIERSRQEDVDLQFAAILRLREQTDM
jgi:hypothetical protein